MSKEYKTSEAQRKAVRKWTEEHKERKKELDRLHNIRRRERIKREHQALLDIKKILDNFDPYLEPQDLIKQKKMENIVNKALEGNNE